MDLDFGSLFSSCEIDLLADKESSETAGLECLDDGSDELDEEEDFPPRLNFFTILFIIHRRFD